MMRTTLRPASCWVNLACFILRYWRSYLTLNGMYFLEDIKLILSCSWIIRLIIIFNSWSNRFYWINHYLQAFFLKKIVIMDTSSFIILTSTIFMILFMFHIIFFPEYWWYLLSQIFPNKKAYKTHILFYHQGIFLSPSICVNKILILQFIFIHFFI